MIGICKQHRRRLEQLLMLVLGLICGVCISLLLHHTSHRAYHKNDTERTIISDPLELSSSGLTFPISSQASSNQTRILCIVMTSLLKSRAIHIKRTWGRRCNKLIFMNSQLENQQPDIDPLMAKRRHKSSWSKTRASLQHAYENYYGQYDWFLQVSDETFVVVENLHHFLYAYLPETPIYFGGHHWTHSRKTNSSGAAAYVFSKAALERYMNLGHGNASICSNRNYGIERVEIERCFRNVGIVAGDSLDEQGLPRFFPTAPYAFHRWNTNLSAHISSSAISFYYSQAREFYVLDFLIYKLRPFGLNNSWH